MQVLADRQRQHVLSSSKQVVDVGEILFTNGKNIVDVNDMYFSNREIDVLVDGTTTPLPPAASWFPYLEPGSISGISETLNAVTGTTSIGTVTLRIVDVGGKFSALVEAARAAGHGLKRQYLDIYRLHVGDSWDDRLKRRRLQISKATELNGVWTITAKKIDALADKQIMVLHTAVLINSIAVADYADTTVTIARFIEGGFPYVANMSHIGIEKEIMKVLAQPVLSVDGLSMTISVSRAAHGTAPATHDANKTVTEVVNMTGCGIDIATMLFTGFVPSDAGHWADTVYNVYEQTFAVPNSKTTPPATSTRNTSALATDPAPVDGWQYNFYYRTNVYYYNTTFVNSIVTQTWVMATAPVNLPAHWHAGMDINNHIEITQWAKLQTQLGTKNTTTGEVYVPFNFIFTKAVGALYYAQREIFRLLSVAPQLTGDGRIRLKAYNHDYADMVQNTKSYGDYANMVLDQDLAKSWGEMVRVDESQHITSIVFKWDRYPRVGGEFQRSVTFKDEGGVSIDGEGKEITITSEGLVASNSRGVDAVFVFLSRMLAKYSRPTLVFPATLLHRCFPWEIGDVIRANLPLNSGRVLNQCFELLTEDEQEGSGAIAATFAAQPERATITTFRVVSAYADSAFLNGFADIDIPADRNLLSLNPSGAGMTLDGGDWYVPVGEGGVYEAFGIWSIHATTRIFCSGEFRLNAAATLDGTGNSDKIDGITNGTAGGVGNIKVDHEEGQLKWRWQGLYSTSYCGVKAVSTTDLDIIDGVGAGGLAPLNAGLADIVSATDDGATPPKITSLSGLPTDLAGSYGGSAGHALPRATSNNRITLATIWAKSQGYASYDINYGYGLSNIVGLGPLASQPGGPGGAGLFICARKMILDGNILLDAAPVADPIVTSSPRMEIEVDGCNDFQTYTFTTGKAGPGSHGGLVLAAEADPLKGIHRNNATIVAATLKEVLI